MKLKHSTLKFVIGFGMAAIIIVALIFALPWLAAGAVYIVKLFLPFVLAFIFALAVDPLVRRLQTTLKLRRNWTALVVIVLLIGVAGGIVSWCIYKIINEIRALYSNIPSIYQNLTYEIEILKVRLGGIYEILPANIQNALSTLGEQFSNGAANLINTKSEPFVSGAGSFAKALPKALISTVVFLLSSYFMISDFERVKAVVKKPFSKNFSSKLSDVTKQIKKYLIAYVRAQATIMVIAFCVLFIGLWILKVDFALLIAMGTAFLDALPFFGSGAVLWPWCIISFISGNFKMGIGTIVIYVILVVVRQLTEPRIVSKKMGTNPILTLISMYLGYRLLGIGGMILGPLVMMLIISLYKAGLFEAPAAAVNHGIEYVKKQLHTLKNKFIRFWESD